MRLDISRRTWSTGAMVLSRGVGSTKSNSICDGSSNPLAQHQRNMENRAKVAEDSSSFSILTAHRSQVNIGLLRTSQLVSCDPFVDSREGQQISKHCATGHNGIRLRRMSAPSGTKRRSSNVLKASTACSQSFLAWPKAWCTRVSEISGHQDGSPVVAG